MSLFGKKEATPQPEVVVEEVPVAEVKKSSGTVIATGMTLEGNFETDEQMDIHGTVKGNIKSSVDTHVAETGKHVGRMDVKSLHLDGNVNSDVICSELASLSDTAVFNGTLKTANFDAAHGSNFEGTLSLNKKTAPAASKAASDEDLMFKAFEAK